ncbi:MAG: 16S rRNA (uracil(1498)-N(3))-methyltransferase [Ignavibacteriae bacterium]|nr:16S rRNA (uracil(1498)-N(3))-methyltransferase [Ignavibacteriota bacterium]
MDYFYCPSDHITKDTLIIDGEEFAHLTHVMRKKVGDVFFVVDGNGRAYEVRFDEIKKKTARCSILQQHSDYHEPTKDVTLGVGVLKNPSRFDFLVEKVTELGVKEIIPLHTKRTIPSHGKVDRWQKLALAAMKQSGRSYLPRVKPLMTLAEVFTHCRESNLKLIAHEKTNTPTRLQKIITASAQSVTILIGPEGGFSDHEVERAIAAGYTPVALGKGRLRTETAAIVLTAFMLIPVYPC